MPATRYPLAGFQRFFCVTLVAVVTLSSVLPVAALETLRERQRIETESRTKGIDVPVLRQRHRREKFQRQQNVLRETDRAKGPELRIDVPVRRMQRNCQLQPFGANFLPNCR